MLDQTKGKLVALRPPAASPGSSLLKNGFFGAASYIHGGESEHWLRPYARLRESAACHGIDLMTEDLVDLSKAAALVLVDLPSDLRQIAAIRARYPHLKLILMMIESPIGRLWSFDLRNLRQFDAVISYDDHHKVQPGIFVYKIPAGGLDDWSGPLVDTAWDERRLACMVAIMKEAPSKLPSRTGIGMLRRGWRFDIGTWWNYATHGGSLLAERQIMAAELSRHAPNNFDIFGSNWDTAKSVAIRRCARGLLAESKLSFLGRYKFGLAFENCRNDCGYISEKIFDVLLAGSVPVYLGNQSISKHIPPEVFVDAARFKTLRDVASYLPTVSHRQWQGYRNAAQAWLRGTAKETFGAVQSTRAIIGAITYALHRDNIELQPEERSIL